MNFFDKHFFGYLPDIARKIVRGVCLIILVYLIFQLALTFIIVIFLFGITSRLLSRFYN